jgi:hypothetical protein
LHGWIAQQVTETEETARKAASLCGCHPPAPFWTFRDGDEPTDGRILVADDPHPDTKRKLGRRWNGSYEGLFTAEHIVRHDPAAVLRRCAADRKILDLHRPVDCKAFGCDCRNKCATCDWTESQEEGREPYWGYPDPHVYPCPTARHLAEGYGWKEAER